MAQVKKERLIDSGINVATEVTDSLRTQARQVWLATLGAYAKVGKEGAAYFKELVGEGQALENQGKELISEQVDSATSKVEQFTAELKSRVDSATGGRMQKVVGSLEKGRAELLGRVGIPSRSELQKLSAKLDELSASLKDAKLG
ncbi:phasin family protein [Halopseudomonas pelagia]|uniref:phasin family protein n=1 Tax=Halopseudomonas pelagia TaxID=553151 RepID=UPI0003A389A4|nr:phasin family protein [Halopseudomonas pelagia]|tara:strand:+ start:54 stop:488 length:435 start_codon:yes stop_codon:yes gene_type:complete